MPARSRALAGPPDVLVVHHLVATAQEAQAGVGVAQSGGDGVGLIHLWQVADVTLGGRPRPLKRPVGGPGSGEGEKRHPTMATGGVAWELGENGGMKEG
jgi:hypothetical protein